MKYKAAILFFFCLIFVCLLAMPVQAESNAAQAKAVDLGDQQQSSELAGKPATKTKRPKATPKPPTSTPKPANTSTNPPPTQQSTSAAVITETPAGTQTAMGTGTSVSTSLPTSTFSGEMNTVVTELTATSHVVQMTSTSLAMTASSTPTTVGAATATPNNLELTATSIVETTAPLGALWQATVTGSPTAIPVDYKAPVDSQKSAGFMGGTTLIWILGGGFVVLVFLFYMLGKELKNKSQGSG